MPLIDVPDCGAFPERVPGAEQDPLQGDRLRSEDFGAGRAGSCPRRRTPSAPGWRSQDPTGCGRRQGQAGRP